MSINRAQPRVKLCVANKQLSLSRSYHLLIRYSINHQSMHFALFKIYEWRMFSLYGNLKALHSMCCTFIAGNIAQRIDIRGWILLMDWLQWNVHINYEEWKEMKKIVILNWRSISSEEEKYSGLVVWCLSDSRQQGMEFHAQK